MIYQAQRPIGLSEEQVQAAGKAIAAIRKKHGGVCPPAEYVERARPESSPTHDTLDWDKDAVFERALLAQAREIVSVVVELVEPAADTPRYINPSVTTVVNDTVERGSASPQAVVARPDWASQVERDLLSTIRGYCENRGYLPAAQRILTFLDQMEREGAAKAA